MKKINLIARLLFILGIVSLCIGGVIGLIFTYHWMNIGAIVQFFGSYLFVLLSIAFIFVIIGFILFGLSEMIEQQTLTNQLLAKHEKINLTHFHEKLISEQQPTSHSGESTEGFHFPDSDTPPLHHSIRTKRLMNVDWYTADSDPHWISHMIDKLGEKVHTITALLRAIGMPRQPHQTHILLKLTETEQMKQSALSGRIILTYPNGGTRTKQSNLITNRLKNTPFYWISP